MAEPTAVERMRLVKLGYAMPDGSYYIRAGNVGASDLQNAIRDVGRGQEDSHNAIRVHIAKRAKALGLIDEIPDDWQADGSLKHDTLNELADGFLSHFGITGMRWGGHLPGTEAVGGKGNPDGANGPSPQYQQGGAGNTKAAFIQRGDQSGGNSGGNNGPSGNNVNTPDQQANQSVDFLKNLHDHVAQQTQAAGAEAQNSEPPPPKSVPASSPPATSSPPAAKPKSNLTSQQASAVHAASKKHLAAVSQLHNKAQAAQVAHKKNKKKLATHPVKGHVKKTTNAAATQHAAHMKHLAQTAAALHKAHLVAMAKLKSKHRPVVNAKAGASHLSAQDKAALKQLSPAQRSALNKIPANLRAHASSLSLKQQNNLRLTPNERTALSKLSPKQKAALAKATAASAKKRHEAALAKKAVITGNKSVAAAKKQTIAAQAHRAAAQKTAYNKLRLNAQNGTRHAMDDPSGTYLEHEEVKDALDLLADAFLEHHGVKGMRWDVKKAVRSAYGFPTGTPKKPKTQGPVSKGVNKAVDYAIKHPIKTGIAIQGTRVAYEHRHQITDFGVKAAGTAKIVAHIIKVMNEQRNSPAGQEALAIGRKYVQGRVIHEDDSGSLEHHGVKGMHWGVRRNGGHPSRDEHPVSADAHKAHEVAKTIHEHGTAAVGNEDLQHLVNRQRLLQQHAQLNPGDPSRYKKGLDFVKNLTNDVNTVVNAVNTGQRVVKTTQGLASGKTSSSSGPANQEQAA